MQGVQAFDRAQANSLLRWWRDAGLDTLVEDAPRAWLATTSEKLPSRPAPAPAARVTETVEKALPGTLPELLAWLGESTDTPEARWGRTRLPASGDPKADVMILVDMPEPGDAEAGRLLSGEVGALFDRMLTAIGRSRENIWLAPFASVRKIGRLTDAERNELARIARHHIGLVAPKRLLIMGQAPAEALIGPDWTAARTDLHLLNLGALQVETLTTYTPGALNKTPSFKKDAWRTLQLLMKGLA